MLLGFAGTCLGPQAQERRPLLALAYPAAAPHAQAQGPVLWRAAGHTPGPIQEAIPTPHDEALANGPAHVSAQSVPWEGRGTRDPDAGVAGHRDDPSGWPRWGVLPSAAPGPTLAVPHGRAPVVEGDVAWGQAQRVPVSLRTLFRHELQLGRLAGLAREGRVRSGTEGAWARVASPRAGFSGKESVRAAKRVEKSDPHPGLAGRLQGCAVVGGRGLEVPQRARHRISV